MVCFRWGKFFLWVGLAGLAGLGVGQWAAWVGSYLRPMVVFPLLVGCVFGGMLVFLIRLLDLAHRGSVLVGVVFASAVCVGSEHGGYYLQTQREYERTLAEWQTKTRGLAALSSSFGQAIQQQLPPPPATWGEYLRRQVEQGRRIGPWLIQGGWVWASWAVEAALTLAAALILVGLTLRWPYCSTCQSWYRVVRQGRVPSQQLAQWREVLERDVSLSGPAPRFRLLECLGRCTPGRLELVWEDADGQVQTCPRELQAAQREKLDALWQAAASSEEDSSPPATPASSDLPRG